MQPFTFYINFVIGVLGRTKIDIPFSCFLTFVLLKLCYLLFFVLTIYFDLFYPTIITLAEQGHS